MKILHELELYYFSPNEISSLFDFPKVKTYEILRHLKHKGLILSLESGKYLLLGFQPERVLSNPLSDTFLLKNSEAFITHISSASL